MRDTVLILTNKEERSVYPVIDCLAKMKVKYYRFNTEDFPIADSIALRLKNGKFYGLLRDGSETINWKRIKSIWYRRPGSSQLPVDIHPGCAKFIHDESAALLWSLYTSLSGVFWVNNPLTSFHLLEHNKLYQMKIAASLGIEVPDTLATNDPEELLNFCREHGGIIAVKRLHGSFFKRENSESDLFLFTQAITEAQLLEYYNDIKLAPLIAQEYIPKKIELRITIVGQKIFSCAIHSQDSELTKHDWRHYDFSRVRHCSHDLPQDLRVQLVRLLRKWRLNFGAIDMILTPSDKYVFLEINPNGQWFWIEKIVGFPISQTIAELLSDPILNQARI